MVRVLVLMLVFAAGCATSGVPKVTPSTATDSVPPPSPVTTEIVSPIPTTPVAPNIDTGILGQVVAIDRYSVQLTDLTFSTCDGTSDPGKGFLFVFAHMFHAPGDFPMEGAFQWSLTDAQGQNIGAMLVPPVCAPRPPAGALTVSFEVPGDASAMVIWWNPGDTTGHQAAIALGR